MYLRLAVKTTAYVSIYACDGESRTQRSMSWTLVAKVLLQTETPYPGAVWGELKPLAMWVLSSVFYSVLTSVCSIAAGYLFLDSRRFLYHAYCNTCELQVRTTQRPTQRTCVAWWCHSMLPLRYSGNLVLHVLIAWTRALSLTLPPVRHTKHFPSHISPHVSTIPSSPSRACHNVHATTCPPPPASTCPCFTP